jgi:hypothetical protein
VPERALVPVAGGRPGAGGGVAKALQHGEAAQLVGLQTAGVGGDGAGAEPVLSLT